MGFVVEVIMLGVATGVYVRRESSGDNAASGSRGWVSVGFVVTRPVWRERREWQVIEPWFQNANATRRSVVGVLE